MPTSLQIHPVDLRSYQPDAHSEYIYADLDPTWRGTRLSLPALRLDLSNAQVDTSKPGEVCALRKALEEQEATKDFKCCGLIRNANEPSKMRVFFRSEDEDKVRASTG